MTDCDHVVHPEHWPGDAPALPERSQPERHDLRALAALCLADDQETP